MEDGFKKHSSSARSRPTRVIYAAGQNDSTTKRARLGVLRRFIELVYLVLYRIYYPESLVSSNTKDRSVQRLLYDGDYPRGRRLFHDDGGDTDYPKRWYIIGRKSRANKGSWGLLFVVPRWGRGWASLSNSILWPLVVWNSVFVMDEEEGLGSFRPHLDQMPTTHIYYVTASTYQTSLTIVAAPACHT